jgi:hypothetical protein
MQVVYPLPVASRMTTALRSGDFGSPVLIWSRPHKWEGAEPINIRSASFSCELGGWFTDELGGELGDVGRADVQKLNSLYSVTSRQSATFEDMI